jgi:hypothetical protein
MTNKELLQKFKDMGWVRISFKTIYDGIITISVSEYNAILEYNTTENGIAIDKQYVIKTKRGEYEVSKYECINFETVLECIIS